MWNSLTNQGVAVIARARTSPKEQSQDDLISAGLRRMALLYHILATAVERGASMDISP